MVCYRKHPHTIKQTQHLYIQWSTDNTSTLNAKYCLTRSKLPVRNEVLFVVTKNSTDNTKFWTSNIGLHEVKTVSKARISA